MPEPAPFGRPWIVGVVASLAVIVTIGGPGITIDEPLDVRPGRTYLETLGSRGFGFFDRSVVDSVFRDNAEHPPLGRWLLGIASKTFEPIEMTIGGSRDPVGLYIRSARVAPALAFGLMVGLVAVEAGRRYGRSAGWVAGLALALMPRVFAHAHLAALDTFIACFWILALFTAVRATSSRRPVVGMTLAGLAWGLALLTKIHAWFLPPIILIWCLIHLKPGRALLSWGAWLVSGLVLFFVGWPWLWFDPIGRLRAYLGTGMERISIQVLYFGQIYRDIDVPWHYPWFYLLATVPVGLLFLGGLGLRKGVMTFRADPFSLLLAGSMVLFPLVFSSRIPVYDGERLFLVAFPLMAIWIGRGFATIWEPAARRVRVGLIILLVGQGYGLATIHPFGLSYYNLMTGGLAGAERLGLELTYWGDAVDGPLLDRLASEIQPGQTVAVAPSLAPDQGKVITTRRLARIPIVVADQEAAARSDWLIVSRRSAYWSPLIRDRVARDERVYARIRQGVWLSELLRRRISNSP